MCISSFRIDYIFCVVKFSFSFSNEVGYKYNMYNRKGRHFCLESKPFVSRIVIQLWFDPTLSKNPFTLSKLDIYIERNSIKKKCFQIQLCTSIFRLHCGIEREKRGVRYSFIYSATSGPSEPVGSEEPCCPPPQILTDQSTKRGRLCPSQ